MLQKILSLFVQPVSNVLTKREERKLATKQIEGKIAEAKVKGAQQVTFNDQELEIVRTKGLDNTWKDEYITVSVVSVFNLIVVGGIAAAFGHPQILEGVGLAITALVNAGVDFGFILTATVTAGIGLNLWRKL